MTSRVQQYLDAVAQLHLSGASSLVSVILFGSAASGAFSDSSDVDLIIVLPDETTPEDRRRLRGVVSDLEITYGLRLPATRSKTRWRSSLSTLGVTRTLAFSAAEPT
jgi:predicted nucleotidyltransferase